MRSHIRFHIEAGATLFASPDPKTYDYGQIPSKAALIYGEDVENFSIEGRGTVDGQAEYDWRPDDFERGYDHKMMMEKLGKPLMRSFPRGFPPREVFPHLVWLGRCKDVHISGLRKKLGDDAKTPRFIRTVRAAGYMLINPDAEGD